MPQNTIDTFTQEVAGAKRKKAQRGKKNGLRARPIPPSRTDFAVAKSSHRVPPRKNTNLATVGSTNGTTFG